MTSGKVATNPSVLDRFEEAKAGPLTGAAPSDVN